MRTRRGGSFGRRGGLKLGPEDKEQSYVISWARSSARLQSDQLKADALNFLHAIPSGGGRGEAFIGRDGTRLPPREAVKMKATGTTAGINDLFLPYVRRDATGALIQPGLVGEMKAGRGTLSPEQRRYQAFMRSQGFAVFTWWDWWMAALDVAEYMELEDFAPVMTGEIGKVRIIRNRGQLETYRLETTNGRKPTDTTRRRNAPQGR